MFWLKRKKKEIGLMDKWSLYPDAISNKEVVKVINTMHTHCILILHYLLQMLHGMNNTYPWCSYFKVIYAFSVATLLRQGLRRQTFIVCLVHIQINIFNQVPNTLERKLGKNIGSIFHIRFKEAHGNLAVSVSLWTWRSVVRAWSLPSCCFLKQETFLHLVSFHPGV